MTMQSASMASVSAVRAIPSYEPIQFRGKNSMTPAQKARYREIYRFALSDMERHHVPAERVDQFLWQMHFFVPVQYQPVTCGTDRSRNFREDDLQNFASMSRVMTDIWIRYHESFGIYNTNIRIINMQSRIIFLKPNSWDLILLYSINFSNYIKIYINWPAYWKLTVPGIRKVDFNSNIEHIRKTNAYADLNYFDYKNFVCQKNRKYEYGDGFKIGFKNIENIEINREPRAGRGIN
ncbi:hypothetical protein [Novosphingobium sp.]|uniref:hypothetical protein n=1 Tax=Novosphingobium sp. TaxID=1874826 RepID=UPI003D0FAC53